MEIEDILNITITFCNPKKVNLLGDNNKYVT